jgi:hypothetical protein
MSSGPPGTEKKTAPQTDAATLRVSIKSRQRLYPESMHSSPCGFGYLKSEGSSCVPFRFDASAVR